MSLIMSSTRKQRIDLVSEKPVSMPSDKSMQSIQQLMRSRSLLSRTQPLIPLSVAGTAKLLSQNTSSDSASTSTVSAVVVTVEDSQLRHDKPDVPMKSDGHTLKRTNSIVNVNKPTVGQRTGRGKGKSVRTSLKPDPDINSILSFTVPQRALKGPGHIRKSPGRACKPTKTSSGTGAGTGTGTGSGDRGKERHRNKSTLSNLSSTTHTHRKEMEKVEACDVLNSGGSVRRSARKRARDDVEDWAGHVSSQNAALRGDVNEVDETPAEKVNIRKSRMNLPTSGMRGLRGASAVMNEMIGHPTRATTKHTSNSRDTRNRDRREDTAGIADMQVSSVFSSGGSGRRRGSSAKRRSSSPFFLPSVDHLIALQMLNQHQNQNQNQPCNINVGSQPHSAGTALSMEGNSKYIEMNSTGNRRSPRFIRDSITSNHYCADKIPSSCSSSSSSSISALNDVEIAMNQGLETNAGSFSRNIYLQDSTSSKEKTSTSAPTCVPASVNSTKDVKQSGIEVHNTPTIMKRKKRERTYSESGALLTTPPAQNYPKPSRPCMGSPQPSKSYASSRSTPRRPYSPM